MEVIVSAIIGPIIVYLFIKWFESRKKPKHKPLEDYNKFIKDIQTIVNEPFKQMYKKPGDK
jgi:hypothetical protein